MTEQLENLHKARLVCLAFQDMSGKVAGTEFMRAKVPDDGSKLMENCVAVYDWCKEQKMELDFYFALAFAQFPRDWLRKSFRRSYPPFALASCMETLEKVKVIWQKPLKEETEVHLDTLRNILKSFPPHLRKLALETTLCGASREFRGQLEKEFA